MLVIISKLKLLPPQKGVHRESEYLIERLLGLLNPIAQLHKDRREVADKALSATSQTLNEIRDTVSRR